MESQSRNYAKLGDFGRPVVENFDYGNYSQVASSEILIPNEIIPNLYLGNTFSRRPEILNQLGIRYVITANQETCSPKNANNICLGWDDNPQQPIFPGVTQAYKFIDEHLSKGEKVLVHCTAGVSRSPTVVIYYLMKRYNMPFSEAYKLVKNRRSVVNINKGFEAQLLKLDLK